MGNTAAPPKVAVFWEPGFPEIRGCRITRDILQQALTSFTVNFLSEQELIARLNSDRFDLLITPYGSAFPQTWPELLKYLRGGGNWFNVGGVPLSRPVVRASGLWRPEPHQTTYHKRLGITHSFPVRDVQTSGISVAEVYELYLRFSSTNNEPDEAGSDGPHEAILDSFMFESYADGPPKAVPVIRSIACWPTLPAAVGCCEFQRNHSSQLHYQFGGDGGAGRNPNQSPQ